MFYVILKRFRKARNAKFVRNSMFMKKHYINLTTTNNDTEENARQRNCI
jgi:hypothetical protein